MAGHRMTLTQAPSNCTKSYSKFRPFVIQISRFLNDALSLEASGGPAEQINHVKFRLEEALKTLEAERGHKQTLLREIDGLHEQARYSRL